MYTQQLRQVSLLLFILYCHSGLSFCVPFTYGFCSNLLMMTSFVAQELKVANRPTFDDDFFQANDLALPNIITDSTEDTSQALAQALHEKVIVVLFFFSVPKLRDYIHPDFYSFHFFFFFFKVSALLLLSQEEERYLLERNVHVALKHKVEELQRNLLQVIFHLISHQYFTQLTIKLIN